MTKNNFVSIAAFVFLGVGIIHGLRLMYDWGVMVGQVVVPMWVSWVAVLLCAYLTFQGFKMARHS
jgi:hypothetical protein